MKKKYDFGIVCALPKELAALKLIFDCNPKPGHKSYTYSEGIVNTKSGFYRCIFATSGKNEINASILVKDMLANFDVERIIFTGIALGVPRAKSGDDHVRLGDIVISKSIVKIPRGKAQNGGSNNQAEYPSKPSTTLTNAAENLISDFKSHKLQPWEKFITEACKINKAFNRPSPKEGKDVFLDEKGKLRKVHPLDKYRIKDKPRPRMGNIGSYTNVLKDHRIRSKQAKKFNLSAIEMESGGIAETVSACEKQYLVIQGISDYGDKLKNNVWQNYAALASAAFAKALLISEPYKPVIPKNNILNSHKTLFPIEAIRIFEPPFNKKSLSHYQYKLNSTDYYLNEFNKLLNIEKNQDIAGTFFCKRDYYNHALSKELNQRGIAIVLGPQLVGKSLLVRNYANNIEKCDYIGTYDLAWQISGMARAVRKNSLDIFDIYAIWGKYIIKALAAKKNLSEDAFPLPLRVLLENFPAFKQELKRLNTTYGSETKLENMLEIVERYLFRMGYSGSSIIAIHLEDLHNYLDSRLFRLIIKDISPIFYIKLSEKTYFKSFQKIKLIISARYFPAFTNNMIKVGNLNKDEVKTIIAAINEKWDNKLTELIVDKIFDITSGHIWFLMRFIKLYLKYRSERNDLHPILLFQKIIETVDLWLSESYLNDEEILPDFLIGCRQIKKSLINYDESQLLLNSVNDFLKIKTHTEITINREEYINNPFFIQTGILTSKLNEINSDTGIMELNNKIIQFYYLPKLNNDYED